MTFGKKFQAVTFAVLVGLLMPQAALAAPTAEPEPAAAEVLSVARAEAVNTSPEAIGLTKRKNVTCGIVNSDGEW